MDYENLILERDEGVGIITLNRPEVLNALSRDLYRQIDEALEDLETDDEIRVVVVTGKGERAFSAGADIHEMAPGSRSCPIRPLPTLVAPIRVAYRGLHQANHRRH